MRISTIKTLTDDEKAARILSYLWMEDDYKRAMSAYPEEGATLDGLYKVIVDVFLKQLDEDEKTPLLRGSIKRDIALLSRCLYGDRNYWAKGTKWEAGCIMKAEQIKARRRFNTERLEAIDPLYGILHLKKAERGDIFRLIIKDDKLYEAVLESMDESFSKEDLYNLCEDLILPRIQYGSFKYSDVALLTKASRIAFGDKNHWATANGLDPEQIKAQHRRNKGED